MTFSKHTTVYKPNAILQALSLQPKTVTPLWQLKERASVAHVIAKEKSRRYYRAFLERYLSRHFPDDMGEHHEDLMDCVQRRQDNKRIARCEPRDFGKSTHMLFGAPLWELARRGKWYIALFGAGGGAFWNHYSSLQNELDRDIGNQMLLDDFPHLAPLKDFKGQYVSWNDSRLKVNSGAIVEPRTMGSHVRGMKEGQHRPDLMIFDDPQDEDTVSTDYQRSKFLNRFRGTLVNLIASPGDIYVIGNFLHPDSLIATLLKDKAWDGKLYRAENAPQDERDRQWPIGNTKQDGSSLWPTRWPLERLHARREEIKNRAYALEFMNRVSSDEEIVYDSTRFEKFHLPDMEWDDSYEFTAWWDPSDPKDNRFSEHDFACISVIATKTIYFPQIEKRDTRSDVSIGRKFHWVPEIWLNQARIELQVEAALRLLQKWPIKRLWYEDNGGWGVLMPYLKLKAAEQNISLPLKCMASTTNKVQKIYNAEPVIKSRVFFADHLPTQYFIQWDEFPHGSHDDGPDATVSGIMAAERGGNMFCM